MNSSSASTRPSAPRLPFGYDGRHATSPSLAAGGGRVSTWFANWLRLIGSTDPEHDTHVVGNYITGLVLHQLAIPDPQFDPTEKIISLLECLIRTRPAPASNGKTGPQQPD